MQTFYNEVILHQSPVNTKMANYPPVGELS